MTFIVKLSRKQRGLWEMRSPEKEDKIKKKKRSEERRVGKECTG